ncbi:MAG: DUF4886 domain-containing protein [Myxococcota bacterium]|nr:DUF4886 domain-containing protein [Myxococcota bacterium]
MRYLLMIMLLFGAPSNAKDVRALFIGNSYTFYSNPNLPETFAQIMTDFSSYSAVTEMHALGGYTLGGHAADAQKESEPYGKLTQQAWDFVILQDQSQVPGFPEGQQDKQASLNGSVYLADLADKAGAQVALLVTWGRLNGDATNPLLYPDFETMNTLINTGYTSYASAAATPERRIALIPAGATFQAIKEVSPNTFAALYTEDGSHPSQLGTYATGCIAASALTGRLPTELNWFLDGIDADKAEIIRETVSELVSSTVWTYKDTPYGARPYFPFVARLSDISGKSSVIDIIGSAVRPWLLVDNAVPPINELTLSDAVLRLTDGGVLDVGSFEGADGFLLMDGGTLRFAEHTGDLYQTGGTLELMGDYTLSGNYRNEGGSITVFIDSSASAGGLYIEGAAYLDIILKVESTVQPQDADWSATVITVNDPDPAAEYEILLNASSAFDWRLVDNGDQHRIELFVRSASGADVIPELENDIAIPTIGDVGELRGSLGDTRTAHDIGVTYNGASSRGGCDTTRRQKPSTTYWLIYLTWLAVVFYSRRWGTLRDEIRPTTRLNYAD